MRIGSSSRRSAAGMTMIEVLVALTVLTIAVVIALVLYDAARKSFKKGENAAEQQQAVRIAFDKLNADLRMAGYNFNPDGDPNRPDEQIEAAYDTAIAIRGDFDAGTADETTPETALATGGAFNTVSTGNDEIVAYVLAKPDGSSSGTLSFYADVASPRNGTVSHVQIPNVAMTQDDPPYTLYRVTLSNTDGSPVRTPLVDNVRGLTFQYFSQNSIQLAAADLGGDDAATRKANRAQIRRITVDLEGLTRDPDLGWQDPNDTASATKAHRKFELQGDVTPRNLGMKGVRDLMADVVPPSKPGAPSLHAGHCGGLYVTWSPNPSADGVVMYRVNYGVSSGTSSTQRSTSGTALYVGDLADATTYYVTIQAIDAAGNVSVHSDERSQATSNTTTPKAPTDLAATDDQNSSVRLSWIAVTENTSNVAGDPESPRIRDLGGYRVYRHVTASFTPDVSSRIADESTVRPISSPLYLDISAVNCRAYYYKVSAVDAPCGTESAPTDSVSGQAVTLVRPMPPSNVEAYLGALSRVRVTWQAVTRDENDSQIGIDTYKIWRSYPISETSDPLAATYAQIGTATGALFYIDNPAPIAPEGYRIYYRVSATDDCPNESNLSAPAYPTCSFTGSVRITSPSDGQAVAGVVPIVATVFGGVDTYTKATFTFQHATYGVTETQEVLSTTAGQTSWTYNWLATPPGPYTITVTVENDTGCTRSYSINVTVGDVVGCCLSPPNPTQNPVVMACAGGSLKCKQVAYQVINNGCRTAVSLETMEVTWVDYMANNAKLASVQFDGSTIWSLNPNSASPASTAFSAPKPVIALDRTSSNPVNVTYLFDKVTGDRKGQTCTQDTMTTTYGFRLLDSNGLPTSITGTCGPSQGMFGNLIVNCP